MDFNKDAADPMAAMGGSASPYMKDLSEKLALVKNEVLSQLNVPELMQQWQVSLATRLDISCPTHKARTLSVRQIKPVILCLCLNKQRFLSCSWSEKYYCCHVRLQRG